MDVATALWIIVPLHCRPRPALRRSRALLLFQVAVDLMLLLLPGRLLLQEAAHRAGGAGGARVGGPVAAAGLAGTDGPSASSWRPWWDEVTAARGGRRATLDLGPVGGGAPLFANGQTGLPFPLNAPVWVLGAERGTDVMAFWKLEIAALGGFFLLRRLASCPPPRRPGR